jgi:exopolyphosphatase
VVRIPCPRRYGLSVIVIVIADLDSVASAIAYSWIETVLHQRKSIPLMRFDHSDLVLRKENVHALMLAGLKEGQPELLCTNDIPKDRKFPFNTFALVDHNQLAPSYVAENPTAKVISVIDHHKDEGMYKDTANPRIISPAGSCASLIAQLCPPEVPKDVATLLLCASVIDTRGLTKGGTAVQVDREAVAFLAPVSNIGPSLALHIAAAGSIHGDPAVQRLADELEMMKGDLWHLSTRDLLRRDFKEYTFHLRWADPQLSIRAGLSTIPFPLGYLLNEKGLEAEVQPWMESQSLSVYGILTSFREVKHDGRGKHKREQLWVVRDSPALHQAKGLTVGALAERLFKGLKASAELDLKRMKDFEIDKEGKLPTGMRARVYDQRNAGVSRKVTAPTAKKILESSGPLPDVITIYDL